jgi:hypothetical protein
MARYISTNVDPRLCRLRFSGSPPRPSLDELSIWLGGVARGTVVM